MQSILSHSLQTGKAAVPGGWSFAFIKHILVINREFSM